MKTLTTLLIILSLTACGQVQEEVREYTTSELIANCVEDYMDTAEYPMDMDEMGAIDYIADQAIEYCETKYN